ncbi:MAG TPA: sigma-54 dependent transcriptional regulator, partial [Gemmatimonadales bacterium]|nr:sigma-54 dependent transcriptional regulator [Gemmatimonadales bacterium]
MTSGPLIGVVDDEALTRTWLSEILHGAGYEVTTGASGQDAVRLVQECGPAVLLLDLRLPDAEGIEVLRRCREIDHDLVVIIVTAYGEIDAAVRAVKAGAFHFLEKSADADDLLIAVEKGVETRRLRQDVAVLRAQHRWQFANVELVGRSRAVRDILQTVEKLARTESATVLMLGESGTGKDLVARAIHARSGRRDRPFLEINCTALPEHLVESELFGHERGAFTDARERKKGLAEMADGGTLFLDEIGDMPAGAQVKLLRFLEDGKLRRVGGTTDIRVDVRVIAATNRDLDQAVADETFRGDLYYRLNVVPVRIPPLRERPEDVAPLALYFVERLARDLNRDAPTLTPDAIRMLEAYAWPGNVRELRNVFERALILEDADEIRPEHLPPEIRGAPPVPAGGGPPVGLPPEGLCIEEVERELIQQAIARTG